MATIRIRRQPAPQSSPASPAGGELLDDMCLGCVARAKVAAALFKTPGEVHRASATVKVAKFNVLLTRAEGIVKLLVHDDRKPGQNESKDFRVRPAPFVRGGSCRG